MCQHFTHSILKSSSESHIILLNVIVAGEQSERVAGVITLGVCEDRFCFQSRCKQFPSLWFSDWEQAPPTCGGRSLDAGSSLRAAASLASDWWVRRRVCRCARPAVNNKSVHCDSGQITSSVSDLIQFQFMWPLTEMHRSNEAFDKIQAIRVFSQIDCNELPQAVHSISTRERA